MTKLYKYKTLPVAQLQKADLNPRTHSPAQIEQLRRSIREFGFTNPLLVDEKARLIAGHGRLAAALAEGMAELPVIEVRGLTASQKRALVIADNQLALNAGWDAEILAAELKSLEIEGFDTAILGFNDAEFAKIISGSEPAPPIEELWANMPEFKTADKTSFRSVIVHFRNEADVADFFRLMQQEFTDKTKYLWYPHAPREIAADKRYTDKSA